MKRFLSYAAAVPFLFFHSCQEEGILNELAGKGLPFSEVNDASTYVLNLSLEDARSLNIPDCLYVKAVAITNFLKPSR